MSKNQNLTAVLILVAACFMFVTGAFWGRDKKSGDQTTPAPKIEQRSGNEAVGGRNTVEPLVASVPKQMSNAVPQTRKVIPIPKPKKIETPAMIKPEIQQEQINQVRAELKSIIERTRELEKQAQVDRIKVDEILSQARIHEQILKNMQPPAPIRTAGQVNLAKILDQEKLKLIAARTENNRRELAKLEQTEVKKPDSMVIPSRDKAS